MTLGGAAQLAAAHCLNERTLDPAVCSYNSLSTMESIVADFGDNLSPKTATVAEIAGVDRA